MTHTDQNPELLPCPFCGSSDSPMIMRMHGTASYQVLCDNCGASTGHSDRGDHIEEWNRRNYAIASNPAETARAETGLRDCGTPTTEQSSGVELPEPGLYSFDEQASIVAGDERKFTRTTYTKFKPDEPHTRWYTEQQVRTLLAGVKESLTAAPAVPQGWMPIESAPKDGTLIVVMGNNHGDSELGQHHCIAIWHRGCWMESSDWNATSELEHLTHWMPLPQPPKEQT